MAVTDYQSLYGACRKVALDGSSSIQSIGGFDTFIELHNQDDIDNNYNDIVNGNYDSNNNLITKCSFGSDSDQSHIVLISSDNVEIPENYTLTPINPKKSLVILCNKFINNGTVSMTAKGPNILPHEYYIIGQNDGYEEDIIIPDYANNRIERYYTRNNGTNGNNGVNRQCGSGGTGCHGAGDYMTVGATGSGSAFAGGGGGAGLDHYNQGNIRDVDTTYPMRGGNSAGGTWGADGGVGNPTGNRSGGDLLDRRNTVSQNFGVGGRIIIFCNKFENNGTISADGVATKKTWDTGDNRNANYGGASGGGAVDLFYTNLITEGIITATGGGNFSYYYSPGKGGDGSVTLTQYNASAFILPGYANKETIGKVIELTKMGLSVKADKTELPTKLSQLENDKGFVGRFITPKEVRTIWQDTEV